jgi:hypothetical protein
MGISFAEASGAAPAGQSNKIGFGEVAGQQPGAAAPADGGGFWKRSLHAVTDAGSALLNHPIDTVKGAGKAVAAGAMSMGTLITEGLTGLAEAGVYRAQSGKMLNQDKMQGAFNKGVADADSYVARYKDLWGKITGMNLAPQNKQDEAAANLLAILPDAIQSTGDTVYEKTGSALAGAGSQALLTLLSLKPGIAARTMGGLAKVADAADKVKYQPKNPSGAKVGSAFDELAAKNPDKASALADHIGKADPGLEKYLKTRIKKFTDASDKEFEEIAKAQRDAIAAELAPPDLDKVIKGLNVDQSKFVPKGTKPVDVPPSEGPPAAKPKTLSPKQAAGGNRLTPDQTSSGIRESVKAAYTDLDAPDLPKGQQVDPVIYMSGGSPITFGHISKAFKIGEKLLDVTPGMGIFRAKLGEYFDEIQRNFAPESRGVEAQKAGAILAKNIAVQMQKDSSYFHRAADRRTFWNMRMSEAPAFIDGFERGTKFVDPIVQKAAEGYRNWNQEIFEQDKRNGLQYEPEDNYLYHLYDKPKEVAELMEKKYGKKWGDPGFIKDRVFSLYSEAAKHGFKAQFNNPEDIMLMRQHSSNVAEMRINALKDLETYGLAEKAGKGIEKPDYPTQQWRSPDGTMYNVHTKAYQVLHNAFNTQSLWNMQGMAGDAFRGTMALKNRIVPIKLLLSLYHPIHVQGMHSAAALVRASKELLTGTSSPAKFILDAANAVRQKGIYDDPKMGSKILRAYQGLVKDGELTGADKQALQYMAEGGLTPEMAEHYKTSSRQKFMDAWQQGQKRALWHLPWAAIESVQGVMFEKWIPSLKIASYLKDVQTALKVNPKLLDDPMQRQMAFRKLAKSVDNRYGEMAYNTLFWNRWVKDLAVANTLSLGWQMGFLREYGGGMLDLKHVITDSGTVSQKAAKGMLDRPLFGTYYITQALGYGGLLTYALTGTPPQGLMDYIYPRDGGKTKDGKPSRVGTMFYTKEFASIYKHVQSEGLVSGLAQAAMNKGSGMIGMYTEWATGVNSFNQEIRKPDSPAFQQLEQTLSATLLDLEPISLEAISKIQSEHPRRDAALAFAGFSPAPRYITETPTEATIRGTYDKYYAPKQTPFERAQYSGESRKLRDLYAAGKDSDAEDLLDHMQEKYQLSEQDRRKLTKDSIKETDTNSSVKMFQHFDWHIQKQLLDKMPADERERFLAVSNKKHLRTNYEPPEGEAQ